MAKLTTMKLRTLLKPGRYADGSGLYVQVRGPEQRSWQFRYALSGRPRLMGLGSLDLVSLAEAREHARVCRRLLLDGIDPIEHRNAQRARAALEAAASITFSDVMERYLTAHAAGWKSAKHCAQWRSTLIAYVLPTFGEIPVAAIDTGLVLRAIEPIWVDKPETASRVRGRIEAILDYATARSWRNGDNPARWKGHLANLLPGRGKLARVEHHAALPWQDVPSFMTALAEQPGVGAKALGFVILTASRTGEAIGSTWLEFDLDAATWTIPAERMKAGREHRVPLSDAALAILQGMLPLRDEAHGDFVFVGSKAGRPISNMTMTATMRRMGRGDVTAHGFRSSFRDWAAEQTGFPREVAEAALAHTLKDKVEAAYFRSDLFAKRRHLMLAWAEYCISPYS